MLTRYMKRQQDLRESVHADPLPRSCILQAVEITILGRTCCSTLTIRECSCPKALAWRSTASKTLDLTRSLAQLKDLQMTSLSQQHGRLRREPSRMQQSSIAHDRANVHRVGADHPHGRIPLRTRQDEVYVQTHATQLRSKYAGAAYHV
jgi:hypothetical protein